MPPSGGISRENKLTLRFKTVSTPTNRKMTNHPEIQPLIIEGIQQRKGRKIVVVDLSQIEGSATNTFIICQGTSAIQVDAIADSVREHVQQSCGVKPYNYDGYRNSQWIVIDYGDVFVHVFLPDVRERYNLEGLWSDAPVTVIPDLD